MKLLSFLGWKKSPKPAININEEIYGQLKWFRVPLIIIVLIILTGTLGFLLIGKLSLVNAFFNTGLPFVGFGTLKESLSGAGKVFSICFIIFGFLSVSFAFGVILAEINRGILIGLVKEKRMLKNIAYLRDHFVICYHNNYTVQVTQELRKNHIPFVVVDDSPDLENIARQYKYPHYIKGEPHTEVSMLKSHLSSAKGVISLSNNVADNIAIIASVRYFEREHAIPRAYHVISTANSSEDIEKLGKLGANSVINPTTITAQRVTSVALRPDMENLLDKFLYDENSALDIEEVFIKRESWIVLKTIKETRLRDLTRVSIIGIKNTVSKLIPMPTSDTLITAESSLVVIGTSQDLSKFKDLVAQRNNKVN